ncbi:Rhodanese-like protein [Caldalkalibacillus thermarum TA2.A1]|uniref:MBL fold metallo-hydrolase n=1 Tax=Caldalkalibacillus thermarum (strain TA2.A1) TaxID=986075 RepID=F5L8K6_CALTT|nr:MBL fold metallo-hydrolase [Caldalkalibacillus thermarum]EGL82345.1 Rhodanese-like protein [Caldalkalibacillus thermarum TA2.A1]QZT32907.1 MBL fold metallo-hydrolase [Caldalkalibacillus thermarum TA2.A1]
MSVKSMTAEQVFDQIYNQKEVFILDVRNEEDFNDWKIEGKTVTHVNIPYFDFLDGVDQHLERLPKDQDILVVCAKEGSSKFVAEELAKNGFNTYYLEGGMKAWSTYLFKNKFYEDENMKVYQFIRVGKGCLSYMVISGKEALVVDPARFVQDYMDVANKEGVQITHIVDSHLHADHVSGGPELAKLTGATYYLMKSEGRTALDYEPLENHDRIQFEKVDLQVLAVKTPGHTPGSVSFFVNDKLLFSGDTIFVSGLGRPDLGEKVEEWAQDLYETIYGKISEIADDVLVLPAHYADIKTEMNDNGLIGETLGAIRANNTIMTNATKEEFLGTVTKSASSVKPPNFEDIIALNRGAVEKTEEEITELEIGPNRCAVHHTA